VCLYLHALPILFFASISPTTLRIKYVHTLPTKTQEKEAGNLRWWDINFDSQEMEDLYRKTQAEKHLFQLRIFVILNSLFTFVYSKYMVDGRVNWELRGLLFFFSFLVLPLTIPSVYGKFHVFGDFMLSSVLIIFSCVVVMICFMDLFDGVPTNGYLFMAVLMLLNLTIMYITGTNWFRKMLIILVTLVFYLITVTSYSTACYGLSYEQDYPIVQLIPTKEYFRYQFNCNDYDKFYDLIKQIGFSQMNILLVVYSGYFQEKQKRQEFARKWFLVKGKFNMEKRLKKMSDAEKKRNTQKKGINFGEMRELNFKSPLMKVLATLEKIKIAVSDNDSVMEALNMVETTLKTTDDLNKIDIHKQDLDAGDREFAKFLLSAGGKGHVLRDRVRSVPSLVGVRIEDNEELRSKECGLLTAIGLPDGTRVFGKEHLKALDYLTKYEQWDFDVHLLSAMTNKRPVYYLFCKAMERFYEPFELCLQEMKAFILYVEETYCFDPNQHNPYHNHLHSADVLQTTGYFLNAPFCQQKLGSLDKMATLIAAMMHDYRHKGVNNAYIVNCSPPDELALVHNDLSVLERFHASETFILLNTQKFKANFLANMVSSDYRYLRTSCIEMILATDLSHGYKYIGKFGTKCKAGQDQWGDKQEDILILMQMVIKAADVSHPSKTLNLHKTWTVMITDEFFSQGDLERSNKMTLSPLCDRYINDDIPKSQIGFIDFVVKPTVQPLSNLLKLDEIMKNLTNNYKYWCELVRNQSGLDTSLASLRLEVRTLSDALIKSNGVVLDEHGNNKKLSGAAEAGDEAP